MSLRDIFKGFRSLANFPNSASDKPETTSSNGPSLHYFYIIYVPGPILRDPSSTAIVAGIQFSSLIICSNCKAVLKLKKLIEHTLSIRTFLEVYCKFSGYGIP